MASDEQRRSLWLIRGVQREYLALEADLKPLLRRPPPARTRALLLLAAYELGQRALAERPPVVHFAVEMTRTTKPRGQEGFVNAVLRRLSEKAPEPPLDRARRSHPAWLVERWQRAFGAKTTDALLVWDQEPAPVYLHVKPGLSEAPGEPTQWSDFRRIADPEARIAALELVEQGDAYFQDPLTRHVADLLEVLPHGAKVLDLCAAPGGKSWDLLQRRGDLSRLVVVDLPGQRFERLLSNIGNWKDPRVCALAADVTALSSETLGAAGLPESYDCVILDAPCSNTGVLRRRPDAKTRLARSRPGSLAHITQVQARLLDSAIHLLRPGGHLVYSTCSIESVENDDQIEALRRRHPDVRLLAARRSYPWADEHDGGAAFLLTQDRADNHS